MKIAFVKVNFTKRRLLSLVRLVSYFWRIAYEFIFSFVVDFQPMTGKSGPCLASSLFDESAAIDRAEQWISC